MPETPPKQHQPLHTQRERINTTTPNPRATTNKKTNKKHTATFDFRTIFLFIQSPANVYRTLIDLWVLLFSAEVFRFVTARRIFPGIFAYCLCGVQLHRVNWIDFVQFLLLLSNWKNFQWIFSRIFGNFSCYIFSIIFGGCCLFDLIVTIKVCWMIGHFHFAAAMLRSESPILIHFLFFLCLFFSSLSLSLQLKQFFVPILQRDCAKLTLVLFACSPNNEINRKQLIKLDEYICILICSGEKKAFKLNCGSFGPTSNSFVDSVCQTVALWVRASQICQFIEKSSRVETQIRNCS